MCVCVCVCVYELVSMSNRNYEHMNPNKKTTTTVSGDNTDVVTSNRGSTHPVDALSTTVSDPVVMPHEPHDHTIRNEFDCSSSMSGSPDPQLSRQTWSACLPNKPQSAQNHGTRSSCSLPS